MKQGEIKIAGIDYNPPEMAEVRLDTGEVLEMEVSRYRDRKTNLPVYYTSIEWIEFKSIELYRNKDYVSKPMTIKPELLKEITTKILAYCKENPKEMQIAFYEDEEKEEKSQNEELTEPIQNKQQITEGQLIETVSCTDSDKKLDLTGSSSSNGSNNAVSNNTTGVENIGQSNSISQVQNNLPKK